jgi:hypothetical protein
MDKNTDNGLLQAHLEGAAAQEHKLQGIVQQVLDMRV